MHNKEELSLLKIIYSLIEVTWQFSLQAKKWKTDDKNYLH